MRRYTYIIQNNAITDTSTIQRYVSRNGHTRMPDRQVSEADADYQYCVKNSPESITSEDTTQQYYDHRMIEVREQRRERFRNEVDDLTAELTRRRLINDLTDTEEQTLVDQIAQLSNEIITSLPYPELPE